VPGVRVAVKVVPLMGDGGMTYSARSLDLLKQEIQVRYMDMDMVMHGAYPIQAHMSSCAKKSLDLFEARDTGKVQVYLMHLSINL
jgi:hypothetical protein